MRNALAGVLVLAAASAASAAPNGALDTTLPDGSTFNVELIRGDCNSIESNGTVTIGSNVSLDLLITGGGNEFWSGPRVLINAVGGVTGTFANVTDLNVYTTGNGLTYDNVGGTVTLTLNMNLNPADANFDGATDVWDRVIWLQNKFTFGTVFQTGDFNNDGATDVLDRIIWNSNNSTFATGGGLPPVAATALTTANGPDPEFIYDADTGVMTVNTQGHFLTEIVVPGPGVDGGLPTSCLPAGLIFNSRSDFVLWDGKYFNGKFQAFDKVSAGGDGEFELAQWDIGLSLADFGPVSWGSLPVPGQPGVSGSTPVTPEPATLALLALGGLAVMRRRRERASPLAGQRRRMSSVTPLRRPLIAVPPKNPICLFG